jgi:valyl-tRNA synthetase
MVHLLHPIMPFITEEVWRHLAARDGGMLMSAHWPEPDFRDPTALAEMEWVVAAISAIRTVRSEINVPAAARVKIAWTNDSPMSPRFFRYGRHFQQLARVDPSEDRFQLAGGVPVVVEGMTFILHLQEVVDLPREKARLAKEIGRLDGDLAKFATKLANPAFLERAKPEVVEEQREREAEVRRDRDRLKAAYERLEAV